MDTSRQNSSEEQKNSRMTSNHANTYSYQENSYHQKPPSFNHKQANISLVDDGLSNPKKQQKTNKDEKQQQASGSEWRESIPIKLEHLLFNFKENSLKVYKASPPRIMQIIALITALLLFCGVLALILSQRDDLKKEANLPLDQSAIAERIIGESQLLSRHKLKNSLLEQKNQTGLGEKSRKNYNSAKPNDAAKDASVRKAFGSLLFSGDDTDEIEPDPEENNSDESFDGERSRSRTNFNLFLSDNERQNTADEQKEKLPTLNDQQGENPKVMFIERLMGLHFGVQPKFGLSESLVIRKTIGGDENISSTSDDQVSSNSNKVKESRSKVEEDPTPFLLKYAAAAMLSRVLATAQQQAYMQQLQQQQRFIPPLRFREMNEKNMLNSHPPYYRGYRMMREPAESAVMYGRPMQHPHKHYHPQSRLLPPPFQTAPGQFVNSDRGFSRGPLLSNEEAESQQIHPIILMLNIPYKEQQTPAAAQLMFMGQGQTAFAQPQVETSIQPIFMPYAGGSGQFTRQNPYYKPNRDQQPQVYSSPFIHHKNHNYYPQQSVTEGYYTRPPYNNQPIPMNRGNVNSPVVPHQQRYNPRMTNTIEVPIEIHHQEVSPQLSPSHTVTHQPTAQIIVQPQIESTSQPSENDQDQSNENEHHMVVFYDSSDNINHSEENNSNNQPQIVENQPQQQVFAKENKPASNNAEKTNQQMGKMLLLHFVNPSNNAVPPAMNQPQIIDSVIPEQQNQQPRKPFLLQQEQPTVEKQQQPINNQNNQNKQKLEIVKNEEETSSTSDQMNREEIFEKTTSSDNQNESEAEPASLASHFAQVIRHVIDQQQQQNQEQRQKQLIQPVNQSQKSVSSIAAQQSAQNQQATIHQHFNQPRKDIQIENSNKEVPQTEKSQSESIQESIQSPTFAMLVAGENDENKFN